MNDLTPESIEALPSHDIPRLRTIASELHEATVGALEMMSSHDVSDQEQLRVMMSLKLSESINELDGQLADIEAVKKDLRILKGYIASDRKRIEARKFELLISEKQLRIRP